MNLNANQAIIASTFSKIGYSFLYEIDKLENEKNLNSKD